MLLAAVAGLILIALWGGRHHVSGLNPQAEPRSVALAVARLTNEEANIETYEHASPSVVQVTSLSEETSLFGLNVQDVPRGVGSGFVWDADGHIVTNYHVVQGANGARVTLADHTTFDARQIWADPDQDIAVLWIDASKAKLHPIAVGTSHDLKVGQIVYALGDPFGLDRTMTTGIVSALGREIESSNGRKLRGVIQTSAPINPGNSGGPLLDSGGRLIGMNTAILSPSGTFAGIEFAIPIDEINQVVPQLIRHGKVVHPRIGAQIAEDQLGEQLGVTKGALILKVLPNGSAAQANLQGTRRTEGGQIRLGDVILSIDGKSVDNVSDLRSILDLYQVGTKVTVTIRRDGKTQNIPLVLQSTP
jgi:S1-C subfamily serine protease